MNKKIKTYTNPMEELGMTEEELRADLVAQGLDPDAEVEALRSMAHGMRALLPPEASPGARLSQLMQKRFALFEEAVAAGSAAPSMNDEVKESSLAQILAGSDPSTCIWVKVAGDSMKGAGIHDGDVVLVNTRQAPKNGDIVVAHVAPLGQVVKRLELLPDGTTSLLSENPDFAPIRIKEAGLLEVRGVVVARAGGV